MEQIGERIWVKRFDCRVFGANLGKTVTVMRLASGPVVVHSAGPLSESDYDGIREIGEPGWLMEGSRAHDTFSKQLRAAFPQATYLLPPKFPIAARKLAPAQTLRASVGPDEWGDEIGIHRVGGIPALSEHAVLHRPSRTLILSDLMMNLEIPPRGRIPFFLRWVSGFKSFPATSRLLRAFVRDPEAVAASVETLLAWDFDRVVVGHGAFVENNAKATLASVLAWAR